MDLHDNLENMSMNPLGFVLCRLHLLRKDFLRKEKDEEVNKLLK